ANYSVPNHPLTGGGAADVLTGGGAADVLTEGRRLLRARGCAECHGEDLGGRFFFDAPELGRLYASNLTRGEGGRLTDYDDQGLERAIRHGIRPDGSPLYFMPAHEYWPMSDT